jgi:hypothetical protein
MKRGGSDGFNITFVIVGVAIAALVIVMLSVYFSTSGFAAECRQPQNRITEGITDSVLDSYLGLPKGNEEQDITEAMTSDRALPKDLNQVDHVKNRWKPEVDVFSSSSAFDRHSDRLSDVQMQKTKPFQNLEKYMSGMSASRFNEIA